MDDLLTTRQLQDLLQVDRVTIYRMLNDGRLRGFKVGGQWRFSKQEIDAWLQEQQRSLVTSDPSLPSGGPSAPTAKILSVSCVQAIQDVCAEALDVAAVTMDTNGTLLTEISNSNAFCDQILSTREGRRRCQGMWAADDGQMRTCHAGLTVVSVPIVVDGTRVAVAACCQFAVESADDQDRSWHADVGELASELKLAERSLWAAIDSVRLVSQSRVSRITRLQRRMADTFVEIGQERLSLLSRLQQISKMSRI